MEENSYKLDTAADLFVQLATSSPLSSQHGVYHSFADILRHNVSLSQNTVEQYSWSDTLCW